MRAVAFSFAVALVGAALVVGGCSDPQGRLPPATTFEIYDVSDLLGIEPFGGGPHCAGALAATGGLIVDVPDPVSAGARMDALVASLRAETGGAPAWPEADTSLEGHRGQLLVTQTAMGHARLADVLAERRRSRR